MRLDGGIVEADIEEPIGDATNVMLLTCTSRQAEDALVLSAQRDQVDHLQIASLHQRSSELATL